MRHHALDQRLCEITDARWRGTKLPKLIDLLRAFSALEISPEMILNRSFPRSPTFTHSSPSTKFRQNVRDFHRCPSRFGAAINFIFKTTRARLIFVIKTEHSVDDRNAAFDGDTLECVCDRPAEILRVIGFSLQDHSA